MTLDEKALLPPGFYDMLPPEAGRRMRLLSSLAEFFEACGYALVNPPFMEFETTLLQGAGKALQHETFRLMDPLSRKMLGIRADMTVQVARLATSWLAGQARPLRLSYAGQVVRIKGGNPLAERQVTQAGVELIGVDSVEADVEVAALAVEALQAIGIKGISIDFTLPQLPKLLLDSVKYNKEDRQALEQALAKKDVRAIREYGGALTEVLLTLATPGLTIKQLAALGLKGEAAGLVERLSSVLELLQKRVGKGVGITIDPVESRGFGYHSGIGFSLFSKDSRQELGRGGRYTLGGRSGDEQAVGFTLYVNALFPLAPEEKARQRVFVPYGTAAKDSAALRKKGYITVQGLDKAENPTKAAKAAGCVAVFKGGKVKEI